MPTSGFSRKSEDYGNTEFPQDNIQLTKGGTDTVWRFLHLSHAKNVAPVTPYAETILLLNSI